MWPNQPSPPGQQPPALEHHPHGAPRPLQPQSGSFSYGQLQQSGAEHARHHAAAIPSWRQTTPPWRRPSQQLSPQPMLQQPQFGSQTWPLSDAQTPQQPLQDVQQQVHLQQSRLRLEAASLQHRQQQQQQEPRSQSKRARKRAAKESARRQVDSPNMRRSKRPHSDVAVDLEAAKQQQLKRPRGAAPESVQHQVDYVSLLDLCLRKLRNTQAGSCGISSGGTQGLLTVPQLHAAVNTAAQAQGDPSIAISWLMLLLERYLLALEVPTAKQQKANQQAVTERTSLGVQSAARLVHANIVTGNATDSDDDAQHTGSNRPGTSKNTDRVEAHLPPTAAAIATPAAVNPKQPEQLVGQTEQPQQAPGQQPDQQALSFRQRRHVRFADDGRVVFSPGGASNRPQATAAAAAGRSQQQVTPAVGPVAGQNQGFDEQQQQGPSKLRRHLKFDEAGTMIHSPGQPGALSNEASSAGAAVVPTEPEQHIELAGRHNNESSSSDNDVDRMSPPASVITSAPRSSSPSVQPLLPTTLAPSTTLPGRPPPPPPVQAASVPVSGGHGTQASALSNTAGLQKILTLPVVWDADALDAVVSRFVSSRRICTLMDVRQQLLLLHGLTPDPNLPPDGLLMSATMWTDCLIVKKFFAVSPQMQIMPPVTTHHVVQAALLALLGKWQHHAQQRGQLMSHDYYTAVPAQLQQEELIKVLFSGTASVAASQGWQSCLRLGDLAVLARVTAQQLRLALAAAEEAVMQQMQDTKQQQRYAAQQHWLLPQQLNTERQNSASSATQQRQQPASLAGVCAALGLDSSGYQGLLEATAMLAEAAEAQLLQTLLLSLLLQTSLRDAGQWSEWICIRTFNKNLAALLSSLPCPASDISSTDGGQTALATKAPGVAAQLLQHVLYYTINNRIAELYVGTAPAAAAHSQLPDAQAASADAATQFVHHLQQLQSAFMALFPAGKQYSPTELEQLKSSLLQQLAVHPAGLHRGAADSDASPAAVAAKAGRVLALAQQLLMPASTAADVADGSSGTSSEEATSSDAGDTNTSSSRNGDVDMQQQQTAQQQRQQKAEQYATVSQAQLREALSELAAGFNIAALATLEQKLLERFATESFADLGLGAGSLLQLLQTQPQLLTLITGQSEAQPCDVGAKTDLQDVLRLVRQTAACCAGMINEQTAAAVSSCLCRTYGVQDSRQLGHGSVAQLMQLAMSAADHTLSGGSSSVCVWDVYSLAAPQLAHPSQATDGAEPAAASVGGQLTAGSHKSVAVRCLLAAPLLADLHGWSQWDQVFEPSLGDLNRFITSEGPAAGLIALASPHASPSVVTDNTAAGRSSGVLLKLDAAASREQLQAAAAQGDAIRLIGTALSLVCMSGGLGLAPVSLMAQAVQDGLQTLAVTGGQHRATTAQQRAPCPLTRAGASTAAVLVLHSLTLLPDPLMSALGQQVLLQPLYNLLGSAAAAQDLLLDVACAAATEASAARRMLTNSGCGVAYLAELAVLHRLGWELGVTIWQQDWQERCCSPAPKQVGHGGDTWAVQPSIAPAIDQAAVTQDSDGIAASESHNTALQQLLHKLHQPQVHPSEANAAAAAPAASLEEAPAPAPAADLLSLLPSAAAAASPQQQLIDQIRQQDFGVEVALSRPARELVERQRTRLGRALTRLSKDLYSSNTHFVLELVQNADDNCYAPGTAPTLEFVLLPGAVAVLNNEIGFSEKDVRALCDVGTSTKSVFKVTDAPQLHSAGYHIKFDLQQDPALGYILPMWLTEQERQPAGSAAALSRLGLPFNTSTSIYLPLKQQTALIQQQQQLHTSSLRQRFQDIKPALLLFLDNLSCICVTDVSQPSHSTVMCKQQLGNHVVELRYGEKAQHAEHWLVVRSTVQLPASWHARHQASLADMYNPTAHSSSTTTTQLALAFSLDNLKQPQQQPQQQPVFAFLPLRSYGLKFILQADWQVPSSREAVDGDSLWNQALRDEVPALMVSAMHAFSDLTNGTNTTASPASGSEGTASDGGQMSLPVLLPQQHGCGSLPTLSREAWLDCWLRFLPLQGQAQGFFAGLPQSVATHLRSHPCIPTESGALARPADVLACSNNTVRRLISPEQLQELLGKQFVHSEVTVLHTSADLRSLLGVGEFSPLQVVQLIEQMTTAGSVQHQGVEWVQRMLLCLFGMLEVSLASAAVGGGGSSWSDLTGQLGRAKVLQRLRKLKLLPLQNGSFVSAEAALNSTADAKLRSNAAAVSCRQVFFPLQGMTAMPASAGVQSPQKKLFNSPSASKRPPASPGPTAAARDADLAALAAEQPSLLDLLDAAGVDPGWLTGLRLLSPELFSSLSSDELELMYSGLTALGVCEAQPIDVMQLSALPSMASAAAVDWDMQRLVAWLAFPLLAGLLQFTPIAAAPATAVAGGQTPGAFFEAATPAAVVTASQTAAPLTGRWTAKTTGMYPGLRQQQQQQDQLLMALRECVLVVTTQGTIRLADTDAALGSSQSSSGWLSGGEQQYSSSVYLPACWTSHQTDWQKQFSQLRWKVLSPLYQQLHPELEHQWPALFRQLGAKDLPTIVPRMIASSKLQHQQVKLQQRQQELLAKLQHNADCRKSSAQLPAEETAGAGAALHPLDLASDMDMECSSDNDAIDMELSSGGEHDRSWQSSQQQHQHGQQRHSVSLTAFQEVTLVDAASGACKALSAATEAVKELAVVYRTATGAADSQIADEGSQSAADVVHRHQAGTEHYDDQLHDNAGPLLQDCLCPDLEALVVNMAAAVGGASTQSLDAALTQYCQGMSRLLRLLSQSWDAYSHHVSARAPAAALLRTQTKEVAASRFRRQLQDSTARQITFDTPYEAAQPTTPVPLAWRHQEPTGAAADLTLQDSVAGPSGDRAQLTTFGQLLRCALWPCCFLGGAKTVGSRTRQQQHLLPGRNILLPATSTTSLLAGFELPYLDVHVQHQQLLDVMQIDSILTPELVLKVLVCQATGRSFDNTIELTGPLPAGEQLQPHDSQPQQVGCNFVSSCQLMGHVYAYLGAQIDAATQQVTAVTPAKPGSESQQNEALGTCIESSAAPWHRRGLQQLVASAFQQRALVWLPDAIREPVSQLAAARTVLGVAPAPATPKLPPLQATVCPGRFFRLQELCLSDPSGVLEALPGVNRLPQAAAQAAASMPRTIPRPVLPHYQSLRQLFSDHLAAGVAPYVAADCQPAKLSASCPTGIAEEPSTEQYVAALELLAAEALNTTVTDSPLIAARHLDIWNEVVAVLKVLAGRFAETKLSKSQLDLLQHLLEKHSLLWCYTRNQWCCLCHEPYVADDVRLASVMAKVPGVCLLRLPPAHQAGQADMDVSAQHQLVLLLATLGVPPLSHSVAADVQYEEMSDWHEMAQRIAEALLMAQRWCWHNKTRQEYDAIADVLLPKLDFLTVVAVRDLAISYSIIVQGGETAVSPPVPAAVLQHDMQLLVAPDQPGLYLEMAQQLARLVLGEAHDVAALTDLLLPVLHELSTSGSSNNAEMLMQSRGLPQLPVDVVVSSYVDTPADFDQPQQGFRSSSVETDPPGRGPQIKLWQLFVPSPLALYSDDDTTDAEEVQWDAAASTDFQELADDDDDTDLPAYGGDTNAGDQFDSDYDDDDEQELEEVDEPQAVAAGPQQGPGHGNMAAVRQPVVAVQPQPATQAQVVLTAARPRHVALMQQLHEPVVTPVRVMSAEKRKIGAVLAIYDGAHAAVAAYLAYVSAAAADVERSVLTVADRNVHKEVSAAEAAGHNLPAEGSAAQPVPVLQQPAPDTSGTATAPAAGRPAGIPSCGPRHLVEAAEAAFFKLLDGKTVFEELSHRVLPAAGGAAAALAHAAGLQYGCREHVAFLNKLLTGFVPWQLGTAKQYKSRNIQGPEKEALAKQGKVRLIDVTAMQPLVLWEAAPDVLNEQNKATGRWGEQLVAIYLTVKLAQVAEVVWVNDKQETGLPYDIKVTYKDSRVEYVEVKATAQDQLQQFYISFRELETAAKYGRAFTVVRVFGCPVYCLRPQLVQAGVALVPGDLRVPHQGQQQPAKVKGWGKGRFQHVTPPARHQHTRLLFLQDPVQLLRRQLVRLLMEV